MSSPPSIEVVIARAVGWVLPGTVIAASGLLISSEGDGSLGLVTLHLTLLVAFGYAAAMDMSRFPHRPSFVHLGPAGRWVATAALVIALTTGVVALVTLASSAALRYAPSMQFLQLLSALDIAWVTAATLIGVSWLTNRTIGLAAAAAVAGVCVWSIRSYLDHVGFGADGGWVVDASALMRFVVPYDTASAVLAVAVITFGSRRRAQAHTTRAV